MGYVYLYTGEGAGKTTNALGVALRSVGHGLRVIIIQFLKGRKDIGEYLIRDKLSPEYEIYQFGTDHFVNFENPQKEDIKKAREGLNFAKEKLKTAPNLLILDEINRVVHHNMIPINEILQFLEQIPEQTTVILTGRYAPTEFYERADFVNEIHDIKHPENIALKRGIQY